MTAHEDKNPSSRRLTSSLMFRLLPLQVVLAAVSVANDIVSSLFASNAVGAQAMAAIGFYTPASALVLAIAIFLATGAQLVCGRYMGLGEVDKTQAVFSLGVGLSCALSALLIALHVIAVLSGFTDSICDDPIVDAYLDQYVLGKAVGVLPFIMSVVLSVFLSMENQTKRATMASVAFIVSNAVFHAAFVVFLRLEALGLALAGSLGSWVFAAMMALPFLRGHTTLRLRFGSFEWRDAAEVCKLGTPQGLINLYYAVRATIVNGLIVAYAGTQGLSAYTTVYTFLFIFWAIPDGMIAVSRMLTGICIGEEDRQTLLDITNVVMTRFVPLTLLLSAAVSLGAEPLTNMYFHDPNDVVYQMTLWGFRVYPWCMAFPVITAHFSCYGSAIGKPVLVHVITLLEGLVLVPAFSALLIPAMGLNAVFLSYTLRGLALCVFLVAYAWVCGRKLPTSMADFLVIPEGFGVGPRDRLDLSVSSVEDVVTVSQQVRAFCAERGVDNRRTFLSGLCLEEMAGNVVDHGFSADSRKHGVDIRVVYKNGELILRIKDDCVPFDPAERRNMVDPQDKASNIGIRIVFGIAQSVNYQHMLGLNVLTIRV